MHLQNVSAQKYKMRNRNTDQWVQGSNSLTPKTTINERQRHICLNIDEYQSSYVNLRCEYGKIYLFICYSLTCPEKRSQMKDILYLIFKLSI